MMTSFPNLSNRSAYRAVDTADLVREGCFLSEEDERLVKCLLSERIELSELDEELSRLYEDILNPLGFEIFTKSVIVSSVGQKVYLSFCTGIVLDTLARSVPAASEEKDYWTGHWQNFSHSEWLEVFVWLNWLIVSNDEFEDGLQDYLATLHPILDSIKVTLDWMKVSES